ncbi:hypothetical protein Tco_0749246 [Tanacetum coccineum]|uniref:Uncharacterized protein n=1 Tax=Tanacetum coccineum TaxID=301880 RepID=A0ABQ4Z0P8_9ASTR
MGVSRGWWGWGWGVGCGGGCGGSGGPGGGLVRGGGVGGVVVLGGYAGWGWGRWVLWVGGVDGGWWGRWLGWGVVCLWEVGAWDWVGGRGGVAVVGDGRRRLLEVGVGLGAGGRGCRGGGEGEGWGARVGSVGGVVVGCLSSGRERVIVVRVVGVVSGSWWGGGGGGDVKDWVGVVGGCVVAGWGSQGDDWRGSVGGGVGWVGESVGVLCGGGGELEVCRGCGWIVVLGWSGGWRLGFVVWVRCGGVGERDGESVLRVWMGWMGGGWKWGLLGGGVVWGGVGVWGGLDVGSRNCEGGRIVAVRGGGWGVGGGGRWGKWVAWGVVVGGGGVAGGLRNRARRMGWAVRVGMCVWSGLGAWGGELWVVWMVGLLGGGEGRFGDAVECCQRGGE